MPFMQLPGKWRFAAYTFLPMTVFFFVPLIFVRLPMVVWLWNSSVAVPARDVWKAVGVSALWFAIAVGAVAWPSRRTASARPWTSSALWLGFLGFSTLGVLAALIHARCALPPSLAAMTYWLSFAPVLGVLTGVAVLAPPTPRWAWVFVWMLIGLDLGAVVLQPILLSKVTPAALSVIAILYGLQAGSAPRKLWIAFALLLVPFLLISIPAKEFLREAVYGRDAFRKAEGGCAFQYSVRTDMVRSTAASYLARAKRVSPQDQGLNQPAVQLAERVPLAGYGLARALIRLNRLSDLSYVISQTPEYVAFTHGVTYKPLLSKLIPRVLWGNKPIDETGQFYGHRYGFLAPSDTTHSNNLPIITEAWMSGGWPYVILAAVFLGFILRVMWVYLVGDRRAMGNVVIGAIIVAAAADQESNLSAVVGGLLQAVVLYLVIEAIVRKAGLWMHSRFSQPAQRQVIDTEATRGLEGQVRLRL